MTKHVMMMSVGPDLEVALAELKRRDIKVLNYTRATNGRWIFKVMYPKGYSGLLENKQAAQISEVADPT